MITFFVRRFLTSAFVVLVSSFIMYVLVDLAIDPIADLRTSSAFNKEELIQQRVALLNLDESVIVRYFDWLKGASGCVVGDCDLGANWYNRKLVTDLIAGAIGTTLQLVTAATVLAILCGCAVGIVSALRQYTGFDYSITFLSFLLYSLPVFWVAVLAKEFIAIDFNDFLRDPQIPIWFMAGAALITGIFLSAAVGGSILARLRTFAIAAGVIVGICLYLNATDWFAEPSLGIGVVAVAAVGFAFLMTTLSTGLKNRRALYSALTVAGIGVALYYPMFTYWGSVDESWLMLAGLAVVGVLVGVVVGFAWGGPDWTRSARTAALTTLPIGAMLVIERALRAWPEYVDAVGGRPIKTSGERTPNLEGSFWIQSLDAFTHLLLPSLTLVLISFAGYTRYSRASTLEVLNQDYIRTARSKGLTERTVVMRHAFRNALLPLASIVPVDIITLVGGAVITERVFNWNGMGNLFINSLGDNQQYPVMAYILIIGILAVVANFVADLVYAVLDPRIRVNA
ncbi:MAG TPA: ABC transporter permease [Nocardioidaceae bacterium]|nr:ABC transporter permease [Nocardioidaceae bacterium]